MAQIIGFFHKKPPAKDWTNQDVAELYRVEAALVQAGLRVETERGVTDEGDPWFVFCRRDTGDVVVHFARIGGAYVVDAAAVGKVLSGPSLSEIVRGFVDDNPVFIPSPRAERHSGPGGGNVVLHPSALLTIFVATVLLTALPDESLAAGVALDTEAAADDNFAAIAAQAAGFKPAGDDRADRTAEQAAIVAAVAFAAEAARMAWDGAGAESADLGAGRTFEQLPALATDESVDLTFFDAWSLGRADGRDGARDAASGVGEDIVFTAGTGLVSKGAVKSAAPGVDAVAVHVVADLDLPLTADLTGRFDFAQPVETSEVIVGSRPEKPTESSAISVEPSGAATDAKGWVARQIEDKGWDLVILDQASSQDAAEAIAIVEQDFAEMPVAAPDAPEMLLPESGGVADSALDAAYRVMALFSASDTDIAVAITGGTIVMFDASDLAAGTYEIHSWALSDTVTLNILGHADTLADILALG